MPRFHRFYESGTAYFIITNLLKEAPKFSSDECRVLEDILHQARGVIRFKLLGYVIMPDHLHLVVVPDTGVTVSDVMRRFKSYASHELRGRGKYKGRVWQRRFYDRAIRTRAALLETLRYIHENPVAGGLAPQVGDYPFSSYHFYNGEHSRVAIDAFDS